MPDRGRKSANYDAYSFRWIDFRHGCFVRLIKIFRYYSFEKESVKVNVHTQIFLCIILKDS